MATDNDDADASAGASHDSELFPSLNSDNAELSVTEIESLCMNCHEQGTTKLLLTKIPYFKDIVISSFTCATCGYESRSTDLAGRIMDYGIEIELLVRSRADLNRKLVRARGTELQLPELDSSFPSSDSSVTTIEGALAEIVDNLRQTVDSMGGADSGESGKQLKQFIDKLVGLYECNDDSSQPNFTIKFYDPSGNSFLENPQAPKPDPNLKISKFVRTTQQDIKLGILPPEEEDGEGQEEEEEEQDEQDADAKTDADAKADGDKFNRFDEVVMFAVNCPSCNAPTESRMKSVQIPHFKEIVIMATNCDQCGHKDSNVSSCGGIEDKGVKLQLHVTEQYDLTRDILVSDTCQIGIPELEFETEQGSLGGKFTTVEGLLESIRDSLTNANPCLIGDSASSPKFGQFLQRLHQLASGEQLDYHLVLDDAAGNSYIQNVCAPDPDPQLERTEYERNYEQNEALGLNDMRTENYTNDNN